MLQLLILNGALADVPVLMKIDVEGFEPEVLRGASRLLRNPRLQAVIARVSSARRFSVAGRKLL